jgi:hypothetical protein
MAKSISQAQHLARSRGNFAQVPDPPWMGLLQARELVRGVRSYNVGTLDASDLSDLQQALDLITADITARVAAAPKVEEETAA